VLLIYNSNAICDHDFDVFLNGTLIGNRDGCPPPGNVCKASIWSDDEIIDATWDGFPLGCSPPEIETFDLDTSLFVAGTNELRLVTTNTNSIDNFGIVQVVRLREKSGGGYEACKTWLDDVYNSSFAPVTLTYEFEWRP
jgi:hypothetical protein